MRPPWWLWLVAVLVLVGSLVGVGHFSANAAQAKAEKVAQAKADSLHGIAEHVRDSLRFENQWLTAKAMSDSIRAVEADRRAVESSGTSRRARALLAEALSASDSLRRYPPLVAALEAEKADLIVSRGTVRELLATQKQLNANLTKRTVTDSLEILSLRKPLKPDTVYVLRKGSGLVQFGETVALSAATLGACNASLLSFGCVAGAAAVTLRTKPWKAL